MVGSPIREEVCERLWAEPHVEVGDVSVEVKDGVVTLEGTVPDDYFAMY
jgi:osmotically-inducible protein OsmY